MSDNPKRHHYIPQAFLRNFTMDDKHIWVCDKVKKSPIFSTNVINVGLESNLYTYLTKKKKEGSLESTLFSKIDGMAKNTVDKLKKMKQFQIKKKQILLYI